MQELGLDTSRLASVGSPPISMREGAQAFSDLIEKWPDTDAVACVSDPAAFGVLTECQRRGIAVPDQIALCGFGAYEISDVCVPAITTVDPQCYEIGKNTAGLILKAIDTNGKLSPLGTLELESILRIRSSSARS
jgi:LacI family gluconate utilization system Gnt-I transcriptional repressor